jgi:hypothetical protein
MIWIILFFIIAFLCLIVVTASLARREPSEAFQQAFDPGTISPDITPPPSEDPEPPLEDDPSVVVLGVPSFAHSAPVEISAEPPNTSAPESLVVRLQRDSATTPQTGWKKWNRGNE